MAIISHIPVRRAGLKHLATIPAVTRIVPASRHYPMVVANPVWPFIRWGRPASVPIRGTCLDGSEIAVAVHGFAKARLNSAGSMIETAEDHAGRIEAALAAALDDRRLDIPRGHAKFSCTGTQLLEDGEEADAFHCIVNLRIRCITN
jgi:hypothetical protein